MFLLFSFSTVRYEIIGGQAAKGQPFTKFRFYFFLVSLQDFNLLLISVATIGFTQTQRCKEEADILGDSSCLQQQNWRKPRKGWVSPKLKIDFGRSVCQFINKDLQNNLSVNLLHVQMDRSRSVKGSHLQN